MSHSQAGDRRKVAEDRLALVEPSIVWRFVARPCSVRTWSRAPIVGFPILDDTNRSGSSRHDRTARTRASQLIDDRIRFDVRLEEAVQKRARRDAPHA